jgi:23S rRNA pseudouridine2605 synthase
VADERLQKVLARAGIASRRASEELIEAGRVRVDGRVVTELGTRVDSRRARIEVDGQRIVREAPVYVVLHKPRGVVSTMRDPQGRPTVRELLADLGARVYPVGRLDFNTSGVLLATNDGDFADALLHPRRAVPKTYVVKVRGVMEEQDIERWRRGVDIDGEKTQPARARLLRHEGDKTWLELTITEGRNQQIRRMGDATGFHVMRLARTSFAGITSEDLPPGHWRYLTADEQTALKRDHGVPRKIAHPPAGSGAESRERRRPVRRPPARSEEPGEHGLQPRYGGGSPGRRSPTVREDWGGGVRRGATDRDAGDASPRGELSGRGWRTRTTGTAGGVGASGDDYRISGRRRPPRGR